MSGDKVGKAAAEKAETDKVALDPPARAVFYTIRTGMLVAVAWVLIMMDPFGAVTALDRDSQRIFTRITAPFHTLEERENITVILIDDESLESWGETWPVDRGRIAGLLMQLHGLGAEAVFLDLYINENRGDPDATQSLVDMAAMLNENAAYNGKPFFVASAHLHHETAGLFSLGGAAPTYSVLREQPFDYALCPDPQITRDSPALQNVTRLDSLQRYDLYEAPQTSPRCPPGETPHPSPALAMLDHHCAVEEAGSGRACRSWSAERDGAGDLHVRWAYSPGDFIQADRCAGAGRSAMGQSLSMVWAGLFSGEDTRAAQTQNCPPLASFSAKDVYGFNPGAPQIAGRYVFIGADASEALDLTRTPVHGNIPAIYSHAVAFGNLLDRGPAYVRADPPELLGFSLNDWLEYAMVAGAIGLIAWFRFKHDKDGVTEPKSTSGRFAAAGLLIAFPLIVTASFALLTNSAPMNWLGLLLLHLGLSFDIVNEDLENGLRKACRFMASPWSRALNDSQSGADGRSASS
ncbi:MAG: CHASE2 domain-containing protein [Oceanicaulis sp.]